MEAATLQNKKINKGKLKKTIKNVLCRPDPVFWPTVSAENAKILETALSEYKVQIPEFKKLHWKELKLLPKEKRPKPPRIKKVDGLLFGISECLEAIQSGKCAAIVIESAVNPQTIVHPVLEACASAKVPVVCLNGLRKISASNFGITTSCLGVKLDCLQGITDTILLLAKDKLLQDKLLIQITKNNIKTSKTDIETQKMNTNSEVPMDMKESPYLFRSNNKSRAFVPPSDREVTQARKEFIGQDFIKVSDKLSKKKSYMKMMVKRISNNPNRVKLK